jgi:hypothetical protein
MVTRMVDFTLPFFFIFQRIFILFLCKNKLNEIKLKVFSERLSFTNL